MKQYFFALNKPSNVEPTFGFEEFSFHFLPIEDALKTRVTGSLQRNSKNAQDVIFVQKHENSVE